MSACDKCKSKLWKCLGCSTTIPHNMWDSKFKGSVAMYCNCCKHNFVCKNCYIGKPGFNVWKPKFGMGHSVKDVMSGESDVNNMIGKFFEAQRSGKLPAGGVYFPSDFE